MYIKTTNIALDEDKRDDFINHWGKICDYIFVENVSDIWPEYTVSSSVNRYGDIEVPKIKNPICIQPFELLAVTADGEVMPCCADWKRKLSLGNINDISLVDIWNGEGLRNIQCYLLNKICITPCNDCGFSIVSQRDYIDSKSDEILQRLNLKENKIITNIIVNIKEESR